jgi:glycosyltransferase involved in cell wall biosynthesis
MHIALVTHYFPPEVNAPAQRAYDHALAWIAAGHKVTIITAAPSHPYGRTYPGYRNETHEEQVEGIRVLRLRTWHGPNAGRFRRVANYLSFMMAAAGCGRRLGPVDLVISTSPHFFSGLAGYGLSRARKAPWVLEIRDIWPDSIVAVGAAKPSPLLTAIARLARWAYHKSDRIVSVSPGFSEHFSNYGVPPAKVTLAANGVEVKPLAARTDPAAVPELAALAGRFIVAYMGTFGMAHGLQTVLDAAELLKDDPRIGFLLAGSGAERDLLFARQAERGLTNVVLLDQQPRARVAELWSAADASIVHLKDKPVFETVIPTKLLEGMAMAKPILLGVRGQAQAIVEAADAGVTFPPENAPALADAIVSMAQDPAGSRRLGENGRRYVLANFDRQRMAETYLEALVQTRRDFDAKRRPE